MFNSKSNNEIKVAVHKSENYDTQEKWELK